MANLNFKMEKDVRKHVKHMFVHYLVDVLALLNANGLPDSSDSQIKDKEAINDQSLPYMSLNTFLN